MKKLYPSRCTERRKPLMGTDTLHQPCYIHQHLSRCLHYFGAARGNQKHVLSHLDLTAPALHRTMVGGLLEEKKKLVSSSSSRDLDTSRKIGQAKFFRVAFSCNLQVFRAPASQHHSSQCGRYFHCVAKEQLKKPTSRWEVDGHTASWLVPGRIIITVLAENNHIIHHGLVTCNALSWPTSQRKQRVGEDPYVKVEYS